MELTQENKKMLYIPAGFAHGFLTLSDHAEVIYKTTAEYAPARDRGIIWNDPKINIKWPSQDIILSPKDAGLPPSDQAEFFD